MRGRTAPISHRADPFCIQRFQSGITSKWRRPGVLMDDWHSPKRGERMYHDSSSGMMVARPLQSSEWSTARVATSSFKRHVAKAVICERSTGSWDRDVDRGCDQGYRGGPMLETLVPAARCEQERATLGFGYLNRGTLGDTTNCHSYTHRAHPVLLHPLPSKDPRSTMTAEPCWMTGARQNGRPNGEGESRFPAALQLCTTIEQRTV